AGTGLWSATSPRVKAAEMPWRDVPAGGGGEAGGVIVRPGLILAEVDAEHLAMWAITARLGRAASSVLGRPFSAGRTIRHSHLPGLSIRPGGNISHPLPGRLPPLGAPHGAQRPPARQPRGAGLSRPGAATDHALGRAGPATPCPHMLRPGPRKAPGRPCAGP